MSTIPTKLEDWTLEALTALVETGAAESDTHDYKTTFTKGEGKDPAKNLSKLCCAFANTRGGFVVMGVSQKGGKFYVEGIEPSSEVYGNFLKRVKVEPDIQIDQPRRLDLADGKAVYVFHIPNSARKPHVQIKEDDHAFWKRVGSHCKQMSLSEVRSQMRDFEYQRQRLTLLLMDIHFKMEDIKENNMARFITVRFHEYNFELMDAVLSETFGLFTPEDNFVRTLLEIRKKIASVSNDRVWLGESFELNLARETKLTRLNDVSNNTNNALHELHNLYAKLSAILNERFQVTNPYVTTA